jgi:short-subunit dehydrogenase
MSEKVVIITGASSGIGKALAFEFARRGDKLSLAARNAGMLKIIEGELKEMGVDVLTTPTDVSVEEDCKRLIERTMERFGRIDVLINNAGISMRALFSEVDLSVLKKLMDTNFWGTAYCSRYAIPHLLESKGSLVGVSSIAGYKGLPGRTGYSASKFAMHGLLEVIRIENMKKGLHVLIACPGFTASNIRKVALSKDGSAQGETPRDEGSMMSAEEVAKQICKAVECRKPTLILTMQGKMSVLLNKFFPRFMDRMFYNHMAKEPDSPFK